MKFRIVRVDDDAFNGRDHAPERADVGLVVTALGMELLHYEPDTGIELHLADEDVEPELRLRAVRDGANCLPCWTVITDGGRVLEAMDHELEQVTVEEADQAVREEMAHEYLPQVERLRARLRAVLVRQ